jgi:hypothetical protein
VPANSVGTVLTKTLFIFRKGEGSMTLHIMVAGRERFAAPYDPQNMGETASALNEICLLCASSVASPCSSPMAMSLT